MFRKMLSLLGDVAVFGLSSALGQIISFLLLPLYTRQLSTADYGDVAQLQILYALFAPWPTWDDLLRSSVLSNREDEGERKTLINTAMASVLGMTLLLLAVLVIASPILGRYFSRRRFSSSIRLMMISARRAAVTDPAIGPPL